MNILITGASRGIGRELVLKFAQNPNSTIVVLTTNSEQLNSLAIECLEVFNNSIIFHSINFLSENINQELAKLFESINLNFDIVINNAGKLINKPFLQNTLKELEELNKINIYGPYLVCQQIIGKYANKNCHIINIGSMGGVQGSVKFPGLSIYSLTKAALANLTECLAEEFKDTGIKINCLALGSAQTEMLEEAFPGYKSTVSAKEMAEYIFQFSISSGKFFNGKIIPVSVTTP
ncbi:SDR family oxidoreductase [Vicingus serpentipes]|uniref:SDR family oxidoreductase n=1 Tax=Vicingus serpentipes TaxID=1926625 RepID=A0A5C6RUN4_9FLAO|nr:SDR family oxidoreductase [Vicingus serpentipes]TXB65092.1 SDR family oxidoreductase [Vicingus serpentipes]